MRLWHLTYAAPITPVKRAWKNVEWALVHRRTVQPLAECRALQSALDRLGSGHVLPVPDPAIDLYLRRTLTDLHRATAACLDRRYFEATFRLELARTAFGHAIRYLTRYGLPP